MDTKQLETIRARLAAATPGKWEFYDGDIRAMPGYARVCFANVVDPDAEPYIDMNPEDEDLVIHAKDDIAALLALVDKQAAQLKRSVILVAVLLSEFNESRVMDYRICPLCDGDNEHMNDCAVTQARALLAELDGTK